MTSFKMLFSSLLMLTFVLLGAYCQNVGFGQVCSLSNNCRSDLNCISGRCACLYPRHQAHDNTLGICVSLVLGPCAETVNGVTIDIPCVPNAECRNETGFPECACRSGMRQSGRNCRAMFGEACSINSDCHNPTTSSDNAVICKNQRCDCANLEAFDETGRCVGLVGAMCRTGSICVQGATCDRFDSFDGTCRCTGTFTATPDRRCSSFQCPKVQYCRSHRFRVCQVH